MEQGAAWGSFLPFELSAKERRGHRLHAAQRGDYQPLGHLSQKPNYQPSVGSQR